MSEFARCLSVLVPLPALAMGVMLSISFTFAQPPAGPASEPAPTLVSGPMYQNPLEGGIRLGDPFAFFHEGRYYLYATAGRGGFHYWTSTDLVHWEPAGNATHRTEETWGKRAFWAPEVFAYGGRFYMAYSAGQKDKKGFRLCLAVSDSPGGPFKDLHTPWCDIEWSCIDAHVFVDNDGTPYVYFAKVRSGPAPAKMSGMIYGAKLKKDLSGLAGKPVLCAQADQEWEEPNSTFSRCNEGAFVLRRGDLYYMTYSANHYARPQYGIGYATSPSPLGPWTKSKDNPLLAMDPQRGVTGPGHSSITRSPDGTELFIVYHSHVNGPSTGRVLCIDRLVFDADGSMRVIGPTRTPQPAPSRDASAAAGASPDGVKP
jgi:beta-xylosidase